MEERKTYKLGDLVNLYSGGTPNKGKEDYWGGSIPWISAKSMYEDFLTSSDLFITESGLKAGSKLAKKDTILLLTRGSGLFNRIPVCWTERDLAFNQDVKNIVSKDNSVVLNQYLFYWLYGNKSGISSILETTGIGAGKIDTERFLNLSISIPSVDEQKRIIRNIEPFFTKIALNNRINHNLEEHAVTLYKSWFEDDAEYNNWPATTLSAFFNVVTGRKDANFSTPDGPYPFFTCGQTPLRAPSYSFDGKAILLAGNGDFNVKRYIGRFEAYQRTYVLMPFEEKYLSFLYLLMRVHLGDITGGSRGSVIKFITKGSIADYSFRFPPYCVDDKLDVLNLIFAKVDEYTTEIGHLSSLRDQLLPKLINGVSHCC